MKYFLTLIIYLILHMAILSGQRGHNPGPLRAIIGGQPKI